MRGFRLIAVIVGVAAALAQAQTRHPDLSGLSMGGAGVYAISARWPDKFAALLAISGFVAADRAKVLARIQRIPLRIVHGAMDERVPVDGARRIAADLKKAGAPVQYIEYPDARRVSDDTIERRLRRWRGWWRQPQQDQERSSR